MTSAPRADLLALFHAALDAVRPERAMPPALPAPAEGGRLAIVAAGKAAAEMMRVAEARSEGPLTGLAVTRYGHVPSGYRAGAGIVLIEAGHPAPDSNSLRAGHAALDLARSLGRPDRLLVLLSGGGSALLAAPAPGISLEEKQDVTLALLRSGAPIGEINLVRKRLSAIKGGRLAAAAAPAAVTTWLISDVPGDDPALIASGPTVPDAGTAEEARRILARHGIAAPAGLSADTVAVAGGETVVLAAARDALAAAAGAARSLGYEISDLGDRVQGDAAALGREHAALARRASSAGRKSAILSGGETEVTLGTSRGRGGRNLEYLLALAIALDGDPHVRAVAADTDGIDGTGPAAGAFVLPDTLVRARALGLDAADHLARHDSLTFFEALGDLLVTGPTLTNVGDFRALLVG
jgi:hydroxypyruvate reductase